MPKTLLQLSSFTLVLSLAACAVATEYPVVMESTHEEERFVGVAYAKKPSQESLLSLTSTEGVYCKSNFRSFVAWTENTKGKVFGTLSCSDGRTGNWHILAVGSKCGKGSANLGDEEFAISCRPAQ